MIGTSACSSTTARAGSITMGSAGPLSRLRPDAAGTEAEDEVLFRERDGGGPEDAEGAVVGDGGDAEAAGFGREASVAGGDDELIVVDDEFGEGLAVDLADDGDEDAVGDFDGEAEVDGVGVDDAFADETAGRGGVF